MNLVVEIAKMMDAEGAYSEWYAGTGDGGAPEPFTTRQKYFQADYELKAIAILKRLRFLSADEIGEALFQHEMDGWRRLNVPVDRADIDGASIVRAKYFPPSGS